MEKAWDLKMLADQLKSKGLDLAEDAAKLVVEETFVWVEKSVVLSETKYDDFALAVLPAVKPFVMSQIDKIDGKAG